MSIITLFWSAVARIAAGMAIAAQMVLGFINPAVVISTQPIPQTVTTATSSVTIHATNVASTTPLFPTTPAKHSIISLPVSTATTSVALKTVTIPVISAPAENPNDVNTNTRAALINIYCTTGAGGYDYPISGSGVIIDTRGVILTNAHVAQYFLLRDYPTPGNIVCIVRTGSHAQAKYNAELLYLPPAWVDANAAKITATEATSTGQNDYALLLITSTTSGAPLPDSFTNVHITTDDPILGDPVLLAGYPAGLLGGTDITTGLYASSAFSTIQNIFTFIDGGTPDVVSMGGNIVSQAGSSGGAVIRAYDGSLQAIISTASEGATTTATRELHGITVGYINRSLQTNAGEGLAQLLIGDVKQEADTFSAETAPTLTKKLEAALPK